jgi:hypothetical protein
MSTLCSLRDLPGGGDLDRLHNEQDTTVQVILAHAINDLLEKHGRGRPASEAPLPRGGAAQQAYAAAEQAAQASPRPSRDSKKS